jgi:hypothetical protein
MRKIFILLVGSRAWTILVDCSFDKSKSTCSFASAYLTYMDREHYITYVYLLDIIVDSLPSGTIHFSKSNLLISF